MSNVDSSNIYSNNKSTINKNGKPQKKSLKIFRPETLKRAHNDAFMAASIGDLEWLKQTLCILPEIFHDKNGFSPIHVASIHGRLNIIKYLIEDKSIDPNFPSNHGWRPIHLCISTQTGDRAMNCLEYLARMGADINATNEDNVTPLHVAATEGHFECLKALIKLDADTEKKDIRGHTALDLAKIWGHRACGKLLTSILWQEDQKEIAIDNKLKRKNHAQEVLKEIERTYLAHYDDKKESEEKFNEWLKTQGFQPHKTEKSTINTHKNKDNNEVPEMHKEKKVDLNKRKKTNSQKKTLDSKDWNQSTKVLNKSYTTNLDDFYPRDPFTNLPENIDLVLVNRELRGMSLENVKEFMSANISNSSSKLVTSNSRPVYFRPKYVKDLPKKSVNEEKKEERIDSAGVNLTNDPRSFPFKQMSHYINKRGLNKSLHSDSKSDENLNIITRNYGNDLSEYMMDKRHGKLSKKYEKVFIC